MKNVVIIVLAILVLGLGGYLVYDKVIDKDVNEENNKEQKEEYTLLDKDNESVQFLYSYRATNSYVLDKKLYTTEYLKVDDRTQEEKYSIASNVFQKESHSIQNEEGDLLKVLENKKIQNAYERIFGPNTYEKTKNMSFACEDYEIYSKDDNYYVLVSNGCGGPIPRIQENIDEVRKYNDRIEIKTSFCVLGVKETFSSDENMNYYFYYKDVDEKEMIAKVDKNININIFEKYKDHMSHMTYTYKLGEDGFYYYYSSQLDK